MKIGQLSKEVGISVYTIRYYEKIGLLQKPLKDQSGHRTYSGKDIKLINWVACLKNSGMPLEKIKLYSKAYLRDENNQVEGILEQHLLKLKSKQLDIAHYIDVTEQKLLRLKKP